MKDMKKRTSAEICGEEKPQAAAGACACEAPAGSLQKKHASLGFLRQWQLWVMLLPGIIFYAIYRYGPMFGLMVAFKDYSPFLGVFKSPWVGFKHFERLFTNPQFWSLFRNTLILGVLSLLITFPSSIIFALVLNEVQQPKIKKTYQTLSYLPTFLSIVIVCSIFTSLFSVGGFINDIIQAFGGERINFMIDPKYYRLVYIASETWAGLGSGAIIYLAALSGVDQTLYEAAELDGCSRIKKIWYITLPSILPTVMTMLLLRIGNIIRIGPDRTILLYQPSTYSVADIFGSFVYRVGIVDRGYSYASAVGIFESVLAALILVTANKISKKTTGEGIF